MKIEIPKQGRMALSGSGLIKLIQNNHMPVLDLLVRESIQNSLDAARSNVKYVNVDFGIGDFEQKKLAEELEGITDSLCKKFDKQYYQYIYIKDSNTKGLKGPLHFSMDDGTKNRDLLKLIYEIAKPQEESTAGGSWGLGKTIYFRVGIGLVIYYSRVKTPNGKYESRMAACLVENEKDKKSLLSKKTNNSRRGLAWWGDEIQYKEGKTTEIGTIPIRNEAEISNLLSIFNIEPFEEKETGTTIIIPYIDEYKLLNENINQPPKGEWKPYWLFSIEEYLKLAVQRWYPARLMNERYYKENEKAWLRVTVNGDGITEDNRSTTFCKIKDLYNAALNKHLDTNCLDDEKIHKENIALNKLFQTKIAGTVAFKKYSLKELGMETGGNEPSPYTYIHNEKNEDTAEGQIILTYFRKPGMAISYETTGNWVKGMNPCIGEDEILLIVFVLNSDNQFVDNAQYKTIEEYFRAGEKADHNGWFDFYTNSDNPKILDKIQKSIRKKINDAYREPIAYDERKSSSLSGIFGKFLLPPEGFGTQATGTKKSKPEDENKTKKRVVSHKNVKMEYADKDAIFEKGCLIFPVEITSTKDTIGTNLGLEVVVDGNKNIALQEWKNMLGLEYPFEISEVEFHNIIVGEKKYNINKTIINYKRKGIRAGDLTISLEMKDGIGIGVRFSVVLPSSFSIGMNVSIKINDETARLGYYLKDNE